VTSSQSAWPPVSSGRGENGRALQDLVFDQFPHVKLFFRQYAFQLVVGKHCRVKAIVVGKQDDAAGFVQFERHRLDAALADERHVGFDRQFQKQTLQRVASALQGKRNFGLTVGRIVVRTDAFVQFAEPETALQLLLFFGENLRVNQIKV